MSSTIDEWEDKLDEPVDLDGMHCTKTALDKVSLPPKVPFVTGKAVHMQFHGSS